MTVAMKTTLLSIASLVAFLAARVKGQGTPSPTENSLPGPCRSWLTSCKDRTWTCDSEEQYWRIHRFPQLGCPVSPQTTAPPPPPGECRMVDGVCQFTNSTLECRTWLNGCAGYQCGSVSQYNASQEAPEALCPSGNRYPEPDDVCLPINNTCQWYNPCRSWRGFCWSGYNCGTADQYYQFMFGPQPLCSLPPPGWVTPLPPGECALMNGQCDWYNCTAWLDWCRTYWQCGTQYDQSVYQAGPLPPCPAPPPGYQPPAQPGTCQFNVSAGQCQFMNVCPDGSPMVSCFTDPCGECPNYPNARCEANFCGGCFAVYYDERGNNVTDYCNTPRDPCAVVDCRDGYICRNNGGTAECLPSTCSLVDCSPRSVCEVDPNTGVASCVTTCESSCRSDQLCEVKEYNYSYCNPSPCRYPVCYNAPYVSCSSTDIRAKCVANSRCLVQNKTRAVACVQSCYEDNGGCASDQVCVSVVGECSGPYGPYRCSTQVKCLEIKDVSPTCPAGWQYTTCGSNCGSSCEDVLRPEPIVCPAVCYSGCFCPFGLVVFRDRCVDPKECYTLLNNPPAPNPLPVNSTTVLLTMTVPRVTSDGFQNKTQLFLSALQQLLRDSGYSHVAVSIHAVYFDEELKVVVALSGNRISASKASELVNIVSNNADSLPVQVKNVATVPTQQADEDNDNGLSAGVISVIVVAAVLVLMIMTVVAIVVVVILKLRANRQIRQQELLNDMIYSKLSEADDKNSPIIDDVDDVDIQPEKEEL